MRRLLQENVIKAAANGDVEATHRVLQYYSGYIQTLASSEGHLDVEAVCRLESKLLYALSKFRTQDVFE